MGSYHQQPLAAAAVKTAAATVAAAAAKTAAATVAAVAGV